MRVTECARAYRSLGHRVDRVTVYARRRSFVESCAEPISTCVPLVLGWWARQRRCHLGKPRGLDQLRQMWAGRHRGFASDLARRLDCSYDIVQIEHPWNFELAAGLRRDPSGANAWLVYSSHNIESDLHESIWRSQGWWTRAAERLVTQIRAHEITCAQRADLCLATSEADAAQLRGFGARDVIVVPNGVHPFPLREPTFSRPAPRYAIFVASDYPPNVNGFMRWLSPPFDALPPNTAIVLAGSVGRAIERSGRYASDIAAGRLVILGVLAREVLEQTILHADAVVLPITDGGGTNLKTSEALVSRRPVVATPHALRGFEAYRRLPRVHCVDEVGPAFMQRVAGLLGSGPHADDTTADCSTLTWSEGFASLRSWLDRQRRRTVSS